MATAWTAEGGIVTASPAVPADMDPEWLARTCLGGNLPEPAEQHLRLAGVNYADDRIAENHLFQAQALAPGHAALTKMLELDPSDKLNAAVLLKVLARHGQEDEDE